MKDEDVLADSRVSVNPAEKKEKYTPGQRAADAIANFFVSKAFIFSLTGGLVLWMTINTVLASRAFDLYPFILSNLVLSCIATIQVPLIMMCQKRQKEKERRRAEYDYKANLKAKIMPSDVPCAMNTTISLNRPAAAWPW